MPEDTVSMAALQNPQPPTPAPAQAAPTTPEAPASQTPSNSVSMAELSGQTALPTTSTASIAPPADSLLDRWENEAKTQFDKVVGPYVPEWTMKPMAAAEKYVLQPFARSSKEVGNITENKVNTFLAYAGDTAGQMEGDESNVAHEPKVSSSLRATQMRLKYEKDNPWLSGATGGLANMAGQVLGDPKMWPFFYKGIVQKLGTMAAADVAPWAEKLMAKGFGVTMGADAAEQLDNLTKNWSNMDDHDKSKAMVQLLAGAYMSQDQLRSGGAPKTEVETPAQGKETQGTTTTQNAIVPSERTTAGVTADITAAQAEKLTGEKANIAARIARGAAEKVASPSAADEQRQSARAQATSQTISAVGQRVEDQINGHMAIVEGGEAPQAIAGTDTASKYEDPHEMWQAMQQTAKDTTFGTADDISKRETAQWQEDVKANDAKNEQMVTDHNKLVDRYNATLGPNEQPEPHEIFKSENFPQPEKPKTYNELRDAVQQQEDLIRSGDNVTRAQAIVDLAKAQKAMDGWFKQHSDEISPAEYNSVRRLWASSERIKDIALDLENPIKAGNLSASKLIQIETKMNRAQIRRGQAPEAFRRLLGDAGYQNWQSITELFKAVKDPDLPSRMLNWAQYGLEYLGAAAAPVLTHLGIGGGAIGEGLVGITAKAVVERLSNAILFDPNFGSSFGKLVDWMKAQGGRALSLQDIPKDIVNKVVGIYKNSKLGQSETGAVSRDTAGAQRGKFSRRGVGGPRRLGGVEPDVSQEAPAAPPTPLEASVAATEAQPKQNPFEAAAEETERRATQPQPAQSALAGVAEETDRQAAIKQANEAQASGVPAAQNAIDPNARAVTNEGRPPNEALAALRDKELATRRPTGKDAETANTPDHTRGMDAINEADKAKPTTTNARGDVKLGIKATIADKLADYPNSGVSLTDKERANPDTVIKKYVDHFTGNLTDLYNSVPDSIKKAAVQWYETAHYSAKRMADNYGVSHEQAAAVIASLSPHNFWDNNVGLADRFIKHWTEAKNHMWDPKMDEAVDRVQAVQNKKITKEEATPGKVASKVFLNILGDIRGKSYAELEPFAKAQGMDTNGLRRLQSQWLRMYDEAHGNPRTPLYSPDGSLRGTTTRIHVPYDVEAKTLELLEGGNDTQHIHDVMGNGQKIRNFYNNIINPWSDKGHVTIDTHAVGAAWGKPVSGKDQTVMDNFGGNPGYNKMGMKGLYPVYEEAYRQAAQKLGIQPRELQSVTWEAIRSLIDEADKKKPGFRKDMDDIWKDVENKKHDRATGMQKVIARAGGYTKPDWVHQQDWDADKSRPDYKPPVNPPTNPETPVNPNGPISKVGGQQNKTVNPDKPYAEWTQEEKNHDWANRNKLPIDERNRVRLYHSAPEETAKIIAKDGLRGGSFLTDDKATAMQQAGRDRGLKAGELAVFEAWVPLGSFHGGTWAQTIGHLSADTLSLRLDPTQVDGPTLDGLVKTKAEVSKVGGQQNQTVNPVTKTPEFKNWFGKSKVTDAKGNPQVVYHGTTHDFQEFKPERGNADSAYGPGYYFSSNPTDASGNYAGEGPDLTNRIENLTEQIIQDNYDSGDRAITKAAARAQATKQLSGNKPNVMPTYVKMENPVKISPKGGTEFEFNMDEDGNESGNGIDLYNAIHEVAGRYEDADGQTFEGDRTCQKISEKLGPEFSAYQFDRAFKEVLSDQDIYSPGEALSKVFKEAGFDGIQQDAWSEFGKGGPSHPKYGGMANMKQGTTHYVVFDPTQIKSATGNSGAFDPKNPSIANQTVKIGEGETHLTGDVNMREMPDKESKWVGMPRPPIRKVHGRIPAPQLNDMVDWYRANATPEQRMVATAHEIAHEHLQKVNGISMEGSSISLGHARIPGNYKDLSGAYLDTGKGIDAAYQAAHVDKLAGNRAPMLKFLSDYSTQMMGGRAIEEMLNVPAKEVKVHAKGDVNDVKAILANQGMHSLLMDNYLDAATERAKFILQEDWPKIQHMVAQAVQHYGGKIDAATLQKYREGGTYEPKK
jgi:hypothetical protein